MNVTIYHTDGECPECGCKDVEGGEFGIERDNYGPYAYQHVTCNECGCKFVDVYRLEQTEVWK